jgi:hypothetical protein
MKMRTSKIMGTANTKLSVSFYVLAAMALALLIGKLAAADTLELRSGQIIQGKFVGGSVKSIRFQVNGQEMTYPTGDVLNIGFSDQGDASSSSNAAPQDQAPPPPQQDAQATPPGPSTPPPPQAAAPPPDAPAAAAPAPAPAPQNPSPAASWPPPSAGTTQGPYITIPAGTTVFIRMIDGVDSSRNQVGDTFHASLESALVVGNTVVAPRGADAYGKLTQAKEAGKISGAPELTLELTGIRIGDRIVPLDTTDYDLAGKGRGTQSAQRIGGGAVIGTILGAIAGGGKGAAIGGVVGAGAGTAVQVSTHGETVRVPSETLLEFRLQQDVSARLPAPSN